MEACDLRLKVCSFRKTEDGKRRTWFWTLIPLAEVSSLLIFVWFSIHGYLWDKVAFLTGSRGKSLVSASIHISSGTLWDGPRGSTHLIQTEKPQVPKHVQRTDSGSGGDLSSHLQADLHYLQWVGKDDLGASSLQAREERRAISTTEPDGSVNENNPAKPPFLPSSLLPFHRGMRVLHSGWCWRAPKVCLRSVHGWAYFYLKCQDCFSDRSFQDHPKHIQNNKTNKPNVENKSEARCGWQWGAPTRSGTRRGGDWYLLRPGAKLQICIVPVHPTNLTEVPSARGSQFCPVHILKYMSWSPTPDSLTQKKGV